jgi:hypothetical protein
MGCNNISNVHLVQCQVKGGKWKLMRVSDLRFFYYDVREMGLQGGW